MGNVNRKLSLQGYLEIYSNDDIYSSYSEYLPDQLVYSHESDYVLGTGDWQGMPVYSSEITELENNSYLDPNLYLGYYPKFTSFVFNGIVKWNYMKGSNIYFIYSNNKSVNGTTFNGIGKLKDFFLFNNKQDWVEVLRDQTFMIKIDYWFEK